jgi:hypothetical protein
MEAERKGERTISLLGRSNLNYRMKQEPDAWERLQKDDMKKHLAGISDISKAIGGANMPADIAKERQEHLQSIVELAREKKEDFYLLKFVYRVNDEILQIRESIALLQNAPEANKAGIDALKLEEQYLATILMTLNFYVPGILNLYDAKRNPNAKTESKVDRDLRTMGRASVALLATAMVVVTGLIAFLSNKKNPDFTASAVWAIPAVLAVMGTKGLTKTAADSLKGELTYMSNPDFIAARAAFGKDLVRPTQKLLACGDPSEARALIRTLRDKKRILNTRKDDAEAKKEYDEARKKLLAIFGAGADRPKAKPDGKPFTPEEAYTDTVQQLLDQPETLFNYASPILHYTQSPAAKQLLTQVLEQSDAVRI